MTLLYLADDLLLFYCPIVDGCFMSKIKLEMEDIFEEAKNNCNLKLIHNSNQFKTRLQKRIKGHKIDGEYDIKWKKDDGEYANKIWNYWSDNNNKFPFILLHSD